MSFLLRVSIYRELTSFPVISLNEGIMAELSSMPSESDSMTLIAPPDFSILVNPIILMVLVIRFF